MKRAALLLAALAGACLVAGNARADGDPASDYLIGSQVFLPFDAKLPPAKQRELTSIVAAANKAGYKIRVALIATPYDLGAVTSLWGKPRTYARFLGVEIGFIYKGRLLIVMPHGFGYNWPKHPSDREYAVLAKVPVGKGATGMLESAGTAVQKLAAANGVHVKATATGSHSRSRDRVKIIVASVVLIAGALLVRFALRRRAQRT
jgi:hypothetical protein